ncbi:hypothetical protein FK268_05440 [Tsukamurella sputi]|uniref:Uncharacterized protein n=1 Tax=Tsukamurella sputi TaxID=2591848 RepID=A0A5C5RRF7_9ACTN|nr:hypothetical protein [Tsukamurella sputi]TWS24695.1 hypothetical protein FK268_05440 [Tsukamurella sputi]
MIGFVRAMRSGWTAVTTVVLLGLAVVIMHMGIHPMSMPASAGAIPHHAARTAATGAPVSMDRADHGPSVQKQTVDAVHDHEAHDCAGTVVAHKSMGAPALVTVLPYVDGAPDPTPVAVAALARGPPPWTVLDLASLCVLRV